MDTRRLDPGQYREAALDPGVSTDRFLRPTSPVSSNSVGEADPILELLDFCRSHIPTNRPQRTASYLKLRAANGCREEPAKAVRYEAGSETASLAYHCKELLQKGIF